MWKAKAIRFAVCAGLAGVGAFCFPRSRGVATLASLGVLWVAGLLALKYLVELVACLFKKELALRSLSVCALFSGSTLLPIFAFETYLDHLAKQKVDAEAGANGLTMPQEWQQRPVQVAGTLDAYYWHGKLHVYNADLMRLAGQFPPRKDDTFRVMVLGDSLTYGHGVDQEDTYCRVLDRELGKNYRIECLNLGRCGDQSEDILKTLKAKLPVLRPDLVVYGVCLNDFLPSGMGQYQHMAWEITFPGQQHLLCKTRIGPFLAKKYDDLLVHYGVRYDFYQDILRDFKGYRTRFARDVKEMNEYVVANGLPPLVTMVLDQFPEIPGGDEITAIAEKYLKEAGMEVVPATYRREKGKQQWRVSWWEGHPNETAHRIFARELLPHIEKTPALQQYRID